jgi:MoxR-like ATPase
VEAAAARFRADLGTLTEEISKRIVGHKAIVEGVVTALLAGGHVLLEGVPGLGKTLLVRTLAEATDLTFARIQFTPDLMPADVTGTNMIIEAAGSRRFEFQKGPIFAHVLLADEINRATPKTQSALLEAMQEGGVTVGRQSWELPSPFFVLATQNPVEMEGTYPLPEAQRDRFTARIAMGYPSTEAELAMLDLHGSSSPLDSLEPVASASDVRDLIAAVRRVHVAESLKQYVISLVSATRSAPELRLGASPRATLHLLRASRARAALDGRDFVIPDDVQALAGPVLAHRLLPTAEAMVERQLPDRVVAGIVEQTPLPRMR